MSRRRRQESPLLALLLWYSLPRSANPHKRHAGTAIGVLQYALSEATPSRFQVLKFSLVWLGSLSANTSLGA